MFEVLERAIKRKNYKSFEDMNEKLSILFTNNNITFDEYVRLSELLIDIDKK